MILFFALLAIAHVYAFWLRSVYFYRKPVANGTPLEGKEWIYSLVEGRVVYVQSIAAGKGLIDKGGRHFPIPSHLDTALDYIQIGVFMTPLNNHHLISPGKSYTLWKTLDIGGKFDKMWEAQDDWRMVTSRWWGDWWERKISKYIAGNRRTRFFFSHGVVADLIYDKYVNRLSSLFYPYGERMVLGFVQRGSQVDLFIPADNLNVTVGVGDRVTFDSLLAFYL
jgi:hypothetical protein